MGSKYVEKMTEEMKTSVIKLKRKFAQTLLNTMLWYSMSWWDCCLHFKAKGPLCLGFLSATPPSGTAHTSLPSSVVPGPSDVRSSALPNCHHPCRYQRLLGPLPATRDTSSCTASLPAAALPAGASIRSCSCPFSGVLFGKLHF